MRSCKGILGLIIDNVLTAYGQAIPIVRVRYEYKESDGFKVPAHLCCT